MSQISYLGPSSHYILKNGKHLVNFLNYFSIFYKTKTRTFKRNLRHGSLHADLNSMSGKFQQLKQIFK